jgi:hypothetical protein
MLVCCLLGLFFDPEDGSDMFLRGVTSQTDRILPNHCYENLKSDIFIFVFMPSLLQKNLGLVLTPVYDI